VILLGGADNFEKNVVNMEDIYQAAEDLQVEDIYDTFEICPMTEEEEMYEDIEALRAAISAPSPTPGAPPPLPSALPPSGKPPARPLPDQPSPYNKFTPGYPGPGGVKTTTPGYPGPGATTTYTTAGAPQGPKTTTPGYPGPRPTTPTTTTPGSGYPKPGLGHPPGAPPPSSGPRPWPPTTGSYRPPNAGAYSGPARPPPPSGPPPPTSTGGYKRPPTTSGYPRPPQGSKTPPGPPPANAKVYGAGAPPAKTPDNPDQMTAPRRSNKPQPTADGKFYCGVCREEILGHQGIVTYQDNIWHSYCFKCFGCSRPLRGVKFVRREHEVHCFDCYQKKFAPCCTICKGNVSSDDGMKLQDKIYHRKCFLCSGCSGELVGKKFAMQDNKPFCYDCYLERYSKRCNKCNEYVTGAYIDLGEVVYHEDCFKCSICKNMFEDGMMYRNAEGDYACTKCVNIR